MMDRKEGLSFQQMRALRNQVKETNRERQLEAYRKRLDKIITTKIRTCFIGAIAQFEERFSFLWQDENTSPEMKELWEQARTAVLNLGNAQLRAAQNEIGKHVVEWKRYQTDFVVKKENSDGEETGTV
jgi:hypothetical protein